MAEKRQQRKLNGPSNLSKVPSLHKRKVAKVNTASMPKRLSRSYKASLRRTKEKIKQEKIR